MAVDEWLFATAEERPPVLRLYGWHSPAVSLGRHERHAQVVDLERLAAAGVELVRRPTGGRAVLHDREITYSVTRAVLPGDWSARLDTSLARISNALVRGLNHLGVPARYERHKREQAQAAEAAGATGSLCFQSITRYELSAFGVKAVGSAQLRSERAFLQHGSIPLAPTLGPLWDLGPRRTPRPADRGFGPLPAGLADRPHAELCRQLARGFEEEFGVSSEWRGEEVLDPGAIGALVEAKYATSEWTLGRGRKGAD